MIAMFVLAAVKLPLRVLIGAGHCVQLPDKNLLYIYSDDSSLTVCINKDQDLTIASAYV